MYFVFNRDEQHLIELTFEDNLYSQESGVAMGNMGPSFANLFMGYLKESTLKEYSDQIPEMYCRFFK